MKLLDPLSLASLGGNLVTSADPHDDCSLYHPCALGDPERCTLRVQRGEYARNRAQLGQWSVLHVREETSGARHYLDGQPVHCGELIELQEIDHHADDYGDFTRPTQRGHVVRYEASFPRGEAPRATLHTSVAGRSVVLALDASMRFRWPGRAS